MKNSLFPEKVDKAETTIALYGRLYASFERRIRVQEKQAKDSLVNPAQVAIYFNQNEGSWETKTARLYRAATIYTLKKMLSMDDDRAVGALEIMTHQFEGEEERIARKDDLRKKRNLLRSKKSRGPRQKSKRFSREDAAKLVRALVSMRSTYGPQAATWFVATTLTGLRPFEWKNASFDTHWDMTRALVVKNGKATNGRAHGETRTILLRNLTEGQMRSITSHMENVREVNSNGRFEDFYENSRRCIQRTADKIWPNRTRHPTLYTGRHMFAADAKSVFDKIGVAALMGHASIDTAGENYAKQWTGSGSVGVEPSETDVSAVTSLNQIKIERDLLKTDSFSRNSDWLADALINPLAKNSKGKKK